MLQLSRGPAIVSVQPDGLRVDAQARGDSSSYRFDSPARRIPANRCGAMHQAWGRGCPGRLTMDGDRHIAIDAGPGQSLQPLAIGLGGSPSIDFIAIDWSDGVFQTELGLSGGPTATIVETQAARVAP